MNLSMNSAEKILNLRPLSRSFYSCDPVSLAKKLLGKYLVRHFDGNLLIGKIVEDEAYGGSDDPASHAYRGKTIRNEVMFKRAGLVYIYFTYGNHFCLNVVAEKIGVAGAVLIRALEPIRGLNVIKRNRSVEDHRQLCSGPGKLTKALGIDRRYNGIDLVKGGELYISKSPIKERFEIVATRRIGIKVGLDRLWRFYIKDNRFVSR